MLTTRPAITTRHRVTARARAIAGSLLTAGILLSGCGGSSSPFSGPSHPPAGFIAYHGSGFNLSVPARYQAEPATIPDAPKGSTVTSLTRAGASPEQANSEILIAENPHLSFTLDQVVSNLEREDQGNPSVSRARVTAVTTTVPGARAARIVTESYVAPDSPSNPTRVMFDRKWLMVLIRPGVLLDVVAVNAPKLGGHLDLDTVIDSFRLGR